MPDQLITRTVRAFFAPVDRTSPSATAIDPAALLSFNPAAPAAPWLDLGVCRNFTRTATTHTEALLTGAPASATTQVRTQTGAELTLEFSAWGKLQLALTAGVQQLNVLGEATSLTPGSTVSVLKVDDSGTFGIGDLVVVDIDYTGQTGFLGSGASGGYVRNAAAIGNDTDYVRRVSLNVARVSAVADGTLTLTTPLLAGVPTAAMSVQHVTAFCDREGGTFFQEWAGLFVLQGEQGDRVLFYYPRLQSMAAAAEAAHTLTGSILQQTLPGRFRALPVRDPHDGELVVCYRLYTPAA